MEHSLYLQVGAGFVAGYPDGLYWIHLDNLVIRKVVIWGTNSRDTISSKEPCIEIPIENLRLIEAAAPAPIVDTMKQGEKRQ